MGDASSFRLWTMRLVFMGLALVVMFFHLIPLDTVPRQWAPPDLIMGFCFAWALRRPEFVPALVVAAILLLADLLFHRPPGLMALLVLVGCEYLKSHRTGLPDASFTGEWASVALAVVAITLIYRLVLGVLLVPVPSLAPTLSQVLLTIAVYPILALITQSALGVRRSTLPEAQGQGGRG